MIKKLIISMCCICISYAGNSFAENKNCDSQTSAYCISVDMKTNQKQNNSNNDLCYVLQVNASDQLISGSVPVSQLPEAVFTLTKNQALSGKPIVFKIVKAEIVPSGQCNVNRSNLVNVDQCEIFEYAALAGVSRSVLLIQSRKTASFTCDVTQ
ncbi:MAG: hypothetical protein JO131_09895 [Gammaproteobacteria bacterium]|nr:hypothetical protein [Gammaproteobacteria bacterium]